MGLAALSRNKHRQMHYRPEPYIRLSQFATSLGSNLTQLPTRNEDSSGGRVLEDRNLGDTEEAGEFLGRDRSADLLDFVCKGH